MTSEHRAVPDSVRSKARRRAGFRLEKAHPVLARKLRKEYDTPSYRSRWGVKFYARRTETLRSDLIKQFPKEYDRYLSQEIDNPRNWP